MKEDIKFAAAYIRVSTDRQDEYSPDSQLKLIREYATKEGYIIPEEYIFYDDGISARSIKKRVEFNRMISMASQKPTPFEAILVWKFSRFARNREESIVIKNLLRKKGVKVISVSEPIPEDHYGTLLEGIIEWYDEFYSINLGEEVRRGMVEKVSRGEPICAPGYGYIIRNKMYYPNLSGPAAVAQEMYRRCDEGHTIRSIVLWLNSAGIKTTRGKKWNARAVVYILSNPLYMGKVRISLGGTQDIHNRKFDSENIMIVDGVHEPLVTSERWYRVHARLEATRLAYRKHERKSVPVEYMLRGLVRCDSCGGALTMGVKSGKSGKSSLQCYNYAHGQCEVSHSILYEKIEAAFFKGLEQALETQTFAIDTTRTKPEIDTTNYDKLIELHRRRLERAREAYLAEIDTLEQYSENKKEIEAEIATIEREKAEQSAEASHDPSQLAQRVFEVVQFLRSEDVPEAAKNQALRSIISKIVYQKSEQNIAIYFLDL